MSLILQVARICLPLFAMIFMGMALRRKGMLNDDALTFLTRFVYLFSLPLIIYLGIARQDFRSLINPAIIISTLGGTLLILGLAALAGFRLPASLRGPAAASTFIANVSYLGFPLAYNAFGEAGLTYAGIVNAFTMPFFVVLAILCLSVGHHTAESQTTWQIVRRGLLRTLTSPVFLAAALGIATSLLLNETGAGRSLRHVSWVLTAFNLSKAVLDPLCQVGLPLALLAVGASLRLRLPQGHLPLIVICALAKLAVVPLITLLICSWLFPNVDAAARGTAVLLMACPVGVSFFVFSKQFDANPDFAAGALVTTTLGSCLTLPLWVGVLLSMG